MPTEPCRIEGSGVAVGRLSVTFHRTLRIPEDGRRYPLPPSLGAFPVHRVDDHADRVPAAWRAHGGVFLPMWQREALWMSFSAPPWKPCAVKVAVGMVNAVTGEPWSDALDDEQDYLVCPPQPWLDGVRGTDGTVRQFVAMPLGMGYTVEGQLAGEERHGGIQLAVHDPRPGVFPDAPPRPARVHGSRAAKALSLDAQDGSVDVLFSSLPVPAPAARAGAAEMGLAAGGSIEQQLYPDPHGLATWQPAPAARLFVHIVNSQLYTAITGRPAPATPVDARTYAQHGLPWFDLYDEHLGDLPSSSILDGVRSVGESDAAHGFTGQQDDATVAIPDGSVHGIVAPPAAEPTTTVWPKG